MKATHAGSAHFCMSLCSQSERICFGCLVPFGFVVVRRSPFVVRRWMVVGLIVGGRWSVVVGRRSKVVGLFWLLVVWLPCGVCRVVATWLVVWSPCGVCCVVASWCLSCGCLVVFVVWLSRGVCRVVVLWLWSGGCHMVFVVWLLCGVWFGCLVVFVWLPRGVCRVVASWCLPCGCLVALVVWLPCGVYCVAASCGFVWLPRVVLFGCLVVFGNHHRTCSSHSRHRSRSPASTVDANI